MVDMSGKEYDFVRVMAKQCELEITRITTLVNQVRKTITGGEYYSNHDTINAIEFIENAVQKELKQLTSESDHIKVCEKHPMRKLRKALSDLVGATTKEELEAMELVLRTTPGIEQDKIVAINAIHALLETA